MRKDRRPKSESRSSQFTFHLIPNAHLDPVWLWDWREGANEGLVTCRTILDLMDEDKALTFIRGETFIYEHIEKTDPATFARIRKYVKQGRWDPVGGTVIQPDTNLPDTETFARHFVHGQRYLRERFGRTSKVAWAADSFGHAAGMPEILAAAGIKYFAFTRPFNNVLPIPKPAFWWEGPGGARILSYRPPLGWYGCEREEMPKRLDDFLKLAPEFDLHNLVVFVGLGNHGGGPTRKQIQNIRDWAARNPEVNVVFSTLHRFFDVLAAEVAPHPRNFLPTHEGELNYVLRGCYSSVAKFKFAYRRTEAHLQRAEKVQTLLRGMGVSPMRWKKHGRDGHATLYDAWHSLLFNSFHDILPGSSIERAFDDQLAWLGGAYHAAQVIEFDALNRLASQIDTRVDVPKGDLPSGVSLLVFNPHPFAYSGPLELEAALDYRPIWKYSQKDNPPANLPIAVKGPNRKPIPFQIIETEHHAMVGLAWRKRVVVNAQLPAFGWNVFQMVYDESGSLGDKSEPNFAYSVVTAPGDFGIQIHRQGKPLFPNPGLQVITVEDPWGSWGGMAEEPESIDLSTVRHVWKVTATRVLESGPIRTALWVRLEAGASRLDLTFKLTSDHPAIDVAARLFLNERSARVKLVIPFGERAEYQVPGGTVVRGPAGEVPGGRWVRVFRGNDSAALGFASDALYNFDAKDGAFRVTLARASRYADDVRTSPDVEPWRPAVDVGELRFNFLLTTDIERLPLLARQLEQPPIAILVPPHPGKLARSGSLAAVSPHSVDVLALKNSEDGKSLILRVHETAGRSTTPKLVLFKKTVKLPKVGANQIATYRLTPTRGGYTATLTDIPELKRRT